ncbi:MAG: amidohydrolase [Ruminococcaceae bacterium]|jgi:amidohydrolase|nr:amidohydrolase [Oscillospiraceae bacterium]
MLDEKTLTAEVAALEQEVVGHRRAVHRMAELSGHEVNTSAYVKQTLEALGIPVRTMEGTGLLGILDTGRPGPHIGLRADMDALPLPEDVCNLSRERVVRSDTPDKTCHACGHDAHVAMLLGAAKLLTAHKDDLCGIIYFAFESGEENGAGIAPMLKTLDDYQIDTFWAIHVLSALPSGTICVSAGPRMAGAAIISLDFIGRGGHGSRPDLSINPVFCAANYLVNLAVAFQNQIDANETVTLGVTSIQGGEAANVFPDSAKVLGSIRFFNRDEGAKAAGILKEVATDTAKYLNCRVEFDPRMERVGNPLVNDGYYAGLIGERLQTVLGEGHVVKAEPWYASESFGYYLMRSPGVMAHLGIRNEALGTGAEHHNSRFDVDESVLTTGVRATVEYVLTVIEKGVKPANA